jgi:protein-S-isoprenylcysteine O-methyltransferase
MCFNRTMRPLVFTVPHAWIFWIAYVWAFWPELLLVTRADPSARSRSSRDAGSLRIIAIGMWVAMLIGFFLSFLEVGRFHGAEKVWFWAGVVLLVVGSLLRRLCRHTLGEYFTGDVQARVDQPVIERGPYRWVRHPSYTGGLAMFLGIGLSLTSWASLLVLVATSIAVYSFRVIVEERALVETLGDRYRAYQKRTKRLIPFII